MRTRLVVSSLLVLTVLTGCGDSGESGSPDQSVGAPADENDLSQLVLTNAGADPVVLPAPIAGCIESETQPGQQVLYVAAGRPGSGGDVLYMEVPESELDLPLTITLPWEVTIADGASSEDHFVFASTRGDARTQGNEASSSEEGSSGTVTVLAAGCEIGARVEISVDARLGSEFGDGEAIDVEGGVSTEAIDLDESYFSQQESQPLPQGD